MQPLPQVRGKKDQSYWMLEDVGSVQGSRSIKAIAARFCKQCDRFWNLIHGLQWCLDCNHLFVSQCYRNTQRYCILRIWLGKNWKRWGERERNDKKYDASHIHPMILFRCWWILGVRALRVWSGPQLCIADIGCYVGNLAVHLVQQGGGGFPSHAMAYTVWWGQAILRLKQRDPGSSWDMIAVVGWKGYLQWGIALSVVTGCYWRQLRHVSSSQWHPSNPFPSVAAFSQAVRSIVPQWSMCHESAWSDVTYVTPVARQKWSVMAGGRSSGRCHWCRTWPFGACPPESARCAVHGRTEPYLRGMKWESSASWHRRRVKFEPYWGGMLNSLWLMLLRWVEPGIKVWHSFVLLTRKLNRVWIQSCNSPPKGLEFRLGDGFAALKVEDDVGVACLAGLPAGRPSRFSYSDHLKQVPSEFFLVLGDLQHVPFALCLQLFASAFFPFLSQ